MGILLPHDAFDDVMTWVSPGRVSAPYTSYLTLYLSVIAGITLA